ncbi:MAG: hypothetical protein DRP79_02420 [Planctomycetota bacterium]|nr:MAG: hypothetical protein DRP79_02420 [Planctomycetota bacterium]
MAFFRERFVLRRFLTGACMGVAVTAVVSILFFLGAFDSLECKTLDARFQLFPFEPPSRDVVVVVIDEKSLFGLEFPEKVGGKGASRTWPWERQVYGRMITYLNHCGAKAVVMDLDFSSRAKKARDDEIFANLYIRKNSRLPVITGMEFKREKEEFAELQAFRKSDLPHEGVVSRYDAPDDGYNTVYAPVYPISDASANVGVMNFAADADGVARHIKLNYTFDGKPYDSLAWAAAKIGSEEPPVRTDAQGRLLIKWYDWLKDPTDYYSAIALLRSHDLMVKYDNVPQEWGRCDNVEKAEALGRLDVSAMDDGCIPPDVFKDKIVFIGAQASSLADMKATPVDPVMPGVCINAVAAQNIISRDFMYRSPPWVTVPLLLLFTALTGVTCAMLVPAFRRLWVAAIVLLALIFVYLAVFSGWAAHNFASNSLWMDVAPVWTGIFLTYAAATTFGYVTETRGVREFRKAFSKYLSPELVEELSKDFGSLSVDKGRRQEMTALFSDIRGFTPMSEKMSPEEVVSLLNEYLSAMVDVIFRNGGFLDKYMGDGIMALFTAPRPCENHAELAVRAGCEMLQTVDRLKGKWTDEGRPAFDIGIGIHSGEVIVGNIGSERRMDYTAVGDNVNLASRLEQLNKQFNTKMIVSEETYLRVKNIVDARDLGTTGVKGKSGEIRVYEIVGMREQGCGMSNGD